MNLPRLPRDWYITGLSLELGHARDNNCPLIRLRTDDEGAGAYLRMEVDAGWWSIPWAGTGGAIGAVSAMVLHRRFIARKEAA